jgi:hypothetical protein
LAYYNGTRFDKIQFSENWIYSLMGIGVSYALIIPIFVLIANKIENTKEEKEN